MACMTMHSVTNWVQPLASCDPTRMAYDGTRSRDPSSLTLMVSIWQSGAVPVIDRIPACLAGAIRNHFGPGRGGNRQGPV